MANNDVKEALKGATESIRKFITDVGELRIETRVIPPGQKDSELAASSVLKFDGDNTSVIPVGKTEAGRFEVDAALYDLHLRTLQAAIDYRTKVLASLVGLLR